MNTIHLKGFLKDFSITDQMSDNYDVPHYNFMFDEESEEIIENAFVRVYASHDEISLDEAIERLVRTIFGDLTITGQEEGYSEYTITGFHVSSAKLGKHDLDDIIKNLAESYKYVHVLIDQVKKD